MWLIGLITTFGLKCDTGFWLWIWNVPSDPVMAEVDEDLGVWIRSVALTDEEAIHDALLDLGVTQLEHLQDLTEDDIGRLPIVKIIEKRR